MKKHKRFRKLMIEPLEARQLLAVGISSFSVELGTVTFLGDDADDVLLLGEVDGFLTHDATVGQFADSTDIDPGPGIAQLDVASSDLIEVLGGAGNDIINASGITRGVVTLRGEDGNDTLTGTNALSPLGDTISGGQGYDVLLGLSGDDDITGGEGKDRIEGGIGNDILNGGNGDDRIDLGTGFDEVDGGDGKDEMVFTATSGEFVIQPFEANVVIFAAGDGSSTGLFGAASVEIVSIVSTTEESSSYEIQDLYNTTVEAIGVQIEGGLRFGDSLTILGTGAADTIAISDGTIFRNAEPVITTRWGQVAFTGGPSSSLLVESGDADDVIEMGTTTSFGGTRITVDGGSAQTGFDTLRLIGSGRHLDLTSNTDVALRGIQVIDITGDGDNQLSLSFGAVNQFIAAMDTLRVVHDEGDTVTYGTGWSVGIPLVVGGQYMHLLMQNDVETHVINATPFRNPLRSLDVNRDGSVSPLDALIIINQLDANGPGALLAPTSTTLLAEFFYVDTNGDRFVAPIDVLQIVNFLDGPAAIAEGESATSRTASKDVIPLSTKKNAIGPAHQELVAAIDAFYGDLGLVMSQVPRQ